MESARDKPEFAGKYKEWVSAKAKLSKSFVSVEKQLFLTLKYFDIEPMQHFKTLRRLHLSNR